MGESQGMACRGVRGAIDVEGEGPEAVHEATVTLLDGLVEANGCRLQDVAAAIFTIPDELTGANPAAVAREHGWTAVPLLMVREDGGDTRVARCLRVLLLWNTERRQEEIRHVYLGGAAVLRPDLSPTEDRAREDVGQRAQDGGGSW